MKRSIAVVYVVGLFLLGVLIGALGMHLYQAVGPARIHPPREWGQGQGATRGGFARLAEQLDLTEDQSREIRAIFDESREEARGMHEEMLPRVHDLMERTHDRVEEVLTSDQRERLDQMLSHHRRSLEGLFLGHGPPDQRPRRGRQRGAKGPATE